MENISTCDVCGGDTIYLVWAHLGMVELIKHKNYKKKKKKKGRFGGPVKALSDGRPCIPPSASVQNRKIVRRHQKKLENGILS